MSSPPDTAARLRRLLAILTWLAQEGEAPIDEVAERFDLTPNALVAELEMAACYGVPPYSPDQLLEILVTDDTVSTRVGTALARPRRLSPARVWPWRRRHAPCWPFRGATRAVHCPGRWPSWTGPWADLRSRSNWTRRRSWTS